MEVRSPEEGDDICDRLRAAGVKCAVEPVPDANSMRSIWGGQARTVLVVLVNESDMDTARTVVREFQEDSKGHRVSVNETRPLPDDPSPLGTGFEATCECDWVGPIRESSEAAFRDAHGHSANVSTDIVRAG